MTLEAVLNRNEELIIEESRSMTESMCEIIPVALWVLFKTNQGRIFTCKVLAEGDVNKTETPWEKVEFNSIKEGVHGPF